MTRVELVDTELRIDGTPRVLLCASLFPFRVPREQWRERVRAVAALGYHALDVYIPWNFHEQAPGIWSFEDERDIEHFLTIVQEEGLLVLARPGPYICSEWDGGGLPAWLSLTPGLRVRQNEPLYLAAVEQWFERIMPLLARHQHETGGPVILVQIENELDFFDCDDPHGYVTALAESARAHGIHVPIIACAGQGDAARATGEAAGVIPAINLYPDDSSRTVESSARYAEAALRSLGLPLLVTETNRLHRTLKRLVGSGARLLGPYLQASGWNFDGGTAVNNWGDLLAFMTHDYDFGGVLDPSGAERADAAEGRRLCALVDALGPRLASAAPAAVDPVVTGPLSVPAIALALSGGGQLLTLTELGTEALTVTLSSSPAEVVVEVPPESTLLLVTELPLALSGFGIALAAAELSALIEAPDFAELHFATRGRSEICLRVPSVDAIVTTGDVAVGADDAAQESGLVRLSGYIGTFEIRSGTATLRVVFEQAEAPPKPAENAPVDVMSILMSDALPLDEGFLMPEHSVLPPTLEAAGIYRGGGRYTSRLTTKTLGLVLRNAADVVDVSWGERASAWRANGGGDLWFPVAGRSAATDAEVTITTRIWGHSNFDDPRLPSLRLGSLRGIAGALAVDRTIDITSGWRVTDGPSVGTNPVPLCDLGGWMSGHYPQSIEYRRITTESESGAAALHAPYLRAVLDVVVNGTQVGMVTPLTPTLSIGELAAGDELVVTTHRSWGESIGAVTLLLGRELRGWGLSAQTSEALLRSRREALLHEGALPLELVPGKRSWIVIPSAQFPSDRDMTLRFHGTGLLITAFADGRGLGRVWVGELRGATLRGGRGDVLLVPRGWTTDGIDLFVEATGDEPGTLARITLGGPLDLPEGGEA